MNTVFDRALDALIAASTKKKLGAGQRTRERADSNKPERPASSAENGASGTARYIPAPVRRAVWERDQGQCTFIGAAGQRCGTRHFLQFDHVEPVARGGKPTVEGLRLRCRAHNQYEAERAFGSEFMKRKREEARQRRADSRPKRRDEGLARAENMDLAGDAPPEQDNLGGPPPGG